jgi:beta-carotene 3-hydroxylase
MSIALNIIGFLVGLIAMEGVAFGLHRYVMHGFMWSWHKSHHEPRLGWFELNDLFAIVFAAIAIALFWAGAQPGWRPLWWAAAGVTTYGVLYALVHDGLVHRRFPLPIRTDRGYLRRLVQAHHLHHLIHTKEGAVSFGFLFPQNPERLARSLSERRRQEA